MSDNPQCKGKKSLAAKTDKNMKRYSENEKTLLYELFEKYQEIIDIKLRRNLYSSTKQCEVRECWELILKTFNEDTRTSNRTLKQLQKFWLNANLAGNMSHVSSSDEEDSVCSDVQRAAAEAITLSAVIPEKSRLTYESCYKNFCDWLKESNIKTITEKVMLAFFMNKSKNKKSTTLYTDYSKLKCMIYLNRSVDISRFTTLTAFLKRRSVGHVPKKSKTFSKSDFDRFITEADDKEYLEMKVALIIGIAGACRRDELLKLSTKDVVDSGDCIQISIKDSKTRIVKQFVIAESSMGNSNLINVLRSYMAQRNPRTAHDRFFVGYRSGKCTTQPIGINTIGAIPKKVATFLGLDEVELFTGHCFRRSSIGILRESGADFSVFKRHGIEKYRHGFEGYGTGFEVYGHGVEGYGHGSQGQGLRRMIPYKQQGESSSTLTSGDGKLLLKTEPNPTNDDGDFQHPDAVDDGVQAKLSDSQVFNINYVVPSSLIIREHQPDPLRDEPSGSFQQSSEEINRTLLSSQQTDESDHDDHMQDDSDEALPENENSNPLSTEEKINNLRLQEMENRVTESQLRCEAQRLIVSKAEEELKHLREMNRLRLQEAKLRLKILEQNSANGGGNIGSLSSI